jgi:hypothetical protein
MSVERFRVAITYSSAYPGKEVPFLAVGERDIEFVSKHSSFIRWADEPVRVLIDRIENEYGFTCDAGPLFHCSDWRDLRKLLGLE